MACEWCKEPIDCECPAKLRAAYESLLETMQYIAHFEPDSDRRVVTIKKLARKAIRSVGDPRTTNDKLKATRDRIYNNTAPEPSREREELRELLTQVQADHPHIKTDRLMAVVLADAILAAYEVRRK